MCFYHEYDWVAEINIEGWNTGTSRTCLECRRDIADDVEAMHIDQQEHEACQCDGCYTDEPCEGEDFGETFSAVLCRDCHAAIEAIAMVEANEGCPEHSRRPAFGELRDAIHEDGKYLPAIRAALGERWGDFGRAMWIDE